MPRWKLPQSPSIAQRVAGIVKPQTSLKNRLNMAHSKLGGQISRLEKVHCEFKKKETALFDKIVDAQKRNDRAYAQAYAIELHHLRKTSGMVGDAKLAMEQIQMRLDTMSDLGDIVVTLSPCMAMIKNINSSVGSIMPHMGNSMQDLAGTLNDILGDASMPSTNMMQDQSIGTEAAAILNEAQATLEGQAKYSLPNPPEHAELKSDILQKREAYI
ncbi:MAG: Snf7 domain-containing protein [Cenarchaeum symbiont of Oopsacas minuta]|nr:Snf7 domain-containing protein [Cenarchaeum symbiont of Oopsacas minuta]